MLLFLCLVVAAAILAYYKFTKYFNYWNDRGVQQEDLSTIVDRICHILIRRKNISKLLKDIYFQYPNKRYNGQYDLARRVLIVRDPELLKQITVKNFEHFTDHRTLVSEDADPYWTQNLFSLKGQRWRNMRTILSPSFTSSKMRNMFVLMEECAENVVQHFVKKNEELITLEMKDVFTRFANDVIASSAFGIKVDSLKDPENEFYLMGKEATDFTKLRRFLKFILFASFPPIRKVINVEFFTKEVRQFFRNVISETIKAREEKGIVRPDMVHLLMESRKGKQQHEENGVVDTGFSTAQEFDTGTAKAPAHLTTDDITAQALIFFFAGFETASTLMCFLSYELALNQDIQDRLRKEIQSTLKECGGKLTYEGLLKMKYLDMIVSETLRKYPPAPMMDRVCTKSFTIDPVSADERLVLIEKGTNITIPVVGFHSDPKYYPDPERFDPERFNDENKDKINPYAYFPFGLGPRNCIGSRFALLESKAIIFNLLLHFELVVVEKTPIPLKFSTSGALNVEGGLWVGLKKIRSSK